MRLPYLGLGQGSAGLSCPLLLRSAVRLLRAARPRESPLPSPHRPTVRYGRRSCATVTCLSACPPSRDRRRRLSAARDPATLLTAARYRSILPSGQQFSCLY
jgi:hypothetical protein